MINSGRAQARRMGLLLGVLSCWGWPPQVAECQGIEIREFVPGNYLAGSLHRVVLANAGQAAVQLGGWLLVTRDYSVRLPNWVRIAPGATFIVGNLRRLDPRINLELANFPDFLIRLYSPRVQGNYVALLSPEGRVVKAFYNSELLSVPFLPDTGVLVLPDGNQRGFVLPPESAPVWEYFPFAGDPAVGFERFQGEWRVIPANPRAGSLYPRLAVSEFSGRFSQGVIAIKWATEQEDMVRGLVVERSQDQRRFVPVDTLPARGTALGPASYTFYDDDILPGLTYFYRIRNNDIPSQRSFSQVLEVKAVEVPVEFWMEVFPEHTANASDVGIRFFSAFSQSIKIKLMDESLREVTILYFGTVYADTQNLIKLTDAVPPGHYVVAATTEAKRYFKTFNIVVEP